MSIVEKLLNDSERPADVTLAIKLLLTVIAIGMVQLAILIVRHFEVRSPWFPIFSQLAIYAFSLLLLYRLAQARNWARWALVALLAVAIPLRVTPTLQSISNYPINGTLELAQLGLYVGALVLLFKKSSSEWFARKA
jgi:hypothetical protein